MSPICTSSASTEKNRATPIKEFKFEAGGAFASAAAPFRMKASPPIPTGRSVHRSKLFSVCKTLRTYLGSQIPTAEFIAKTAGHHKPRSSRRSSIGQSGWIVATEHQPGYFIPPHRPNNRGSAVATISDTFPIGVHHVAVNFDHHKKIRGSETSRHHVSLTRSIGPAQPIRPLLSKATVLQGPVWTLCRVQQLCGQGTGAFFELRREGAGPEFSLRVLLHPRTVRVQFLGGSALRAVRGSRS